MVKSLIPKRLLVKETDHFPIACKYMKYDCSLNLNNGFSIIMILALCMFSIVAEHENLNIHHILSSKAMQKMPHFVAMLQVAFDLEENSCMAVTGAHKSSNVETCDTWSCDMGRLAKILLPTVHFPLYKVGKENETDHLHECQQLIPSAYHPHDPGLLPKILLQKEPKNSEESKFAVTLPFFCHLWCFIGSQISFACCFILCHRLTFTEENVKILNPFILLKV